MLRFLSCLVVVACTGCTSQPLDEARARKSLASRISDVRAATLGQDHEKMADLTHPSVLKMAGGRSEFAEVVASVAADLESRGFTVAEANFSEPGNLVESSNQVYAVVPFQLELTGPGQMVWQSPGYLIAVSMDRNGTDWRFIDGAGLGGNRQKLLQLLPHFPKSLSLPATEPPAWRRR